VAQIQKAAKRVIDQVSNDLLSGQNNKKLLANKAVGGIPRYLNSGIQRGWYKDYYGYLPEKRMHQSMLSRVFFNDVLNIGDKGFTHPPSIENLYK
jgi:hypothetical protein